MAGVNARYWLGVWINRWASSQFPWATFSINVSGAFAIGFLTALLARWSPHSHLRLLILVGFLGGYTTFSTFAFESVTLWQRGEWVFSLANMAGSVLAGCAAVVLGAALRKESSSPLGVGCFGWDNSTRDGVDRGIGRRVGVGGSAACPWSRSIPDVGGQPRRDGRVESKGRADGEHPTGSHTPEALSQRQRSAEWQGHLPSGRRDARANHLAGASVFLVDFSYGVHKRIRDAKSDYLSFDIPVVVEAVDRGAIFGKLQIALESMIAEGFAVTRPVQVRHYAGQSIPGTAAARTAQEKAPSTTFASGSSSTMKIEGEAQRVTVYIGNSDTWRGRNLVTAIVESAGTWLSMVQTATVGVMGFGRTSRIHRFYCWGSSKICPSSHRDRRPAGTDRHAPARARGAGPGWADRARGRPGHMLPP